MIKINLIQYRDKKKKSSLKKEIIQYICAAGIFFVGISSYHAYLVVSTSGLEKRMKDAEGRLSELTKAAGEIDKVKGDRTVLEKKIAIIKNLEENRLKPVLLLDSISTLVPAGQLWLTGVTANEADLKLEGVARDNEAIARLMKNLERSVYFRSVDLVASKQIDIAGTKLQGFTLTCAFKKV
jgi:type IV pilus assembly protein PilN